MKLKGVIFDFDGTLADTIPICVAASQKAFERFSGRAYTHAEIVAMFGPSEEGSIRRIVPDRWRECLDYFMRVYESEHERCRAPFPGIEEALRLLRERGAKLAIVTGKGADSAAISIRFTGLEGRFDDVETGSPEGVVKADQIRKIIARWGASPDELAYVGDSVYDMRAANEAGVPALAAAWAPADSLEALQSASPTAMLATVQDLIAWIKAR
jgi:pyrophosphatase PpaX